MPTSKGSRPRKVKEREEAVGASSQFPMHNFIHLIVVVLVVAYFVGKRQQ